MSIPSNLYYSEDHEWLRLESGGNTAFIGITDHAQSELGDIVYVDVDESSVEEVIEAGDAFGEVEAVKTTSELFMPVTGKILEINPALEDSPETVNGSAYEEGWIIKIEISNLKDLDNLLSAKAYGELIGA